MTAPNNMQDILIRLVDVLLDIESRLRTIELYLGIQSPPAYPLPVTWPPGQQNDD